MPEFFRIVITEAGDRPQVVAASLRNFTGFSLAKAEWFLNNLPLPILDGIDDQDQIERIRKSLSDTGATVEVEATDGQIPMLVWHPDYDSLGFVCSQLPPKPYSFSWVIDSRLAGMARPMSITDLEFLQVLSFELIVSLTESPLPAHFQTFLGSRFLHVPIPDLSIPTHDQVDEAVSIIEETIEGNGKVVIHCGAGMGRTGLLLACYLVFQGRTAEEAVTEVRSGRPGSIETLDQEKFIIDYEARVNK